MLDALDDDLQSISGDLSHRLPLLCKSRLQLCIVAGVLYRLPSQFEIDIDQLHELDIEASIPIVFIDFERRIREAEATWSTPGLSVRSVMFALQ